MRAVCNQNSGSGLPPSWQEIGFSLRSTFSLVIGKSYIVFGVALWRAHLLALLCDENSLPNWFPLDLFTLVDGNIPNGWRFAKFSNEPDTLLQALWGYEELMDNRGHYDGLLERDPGAIQIFLKKRALYEIEAKENWGQS